MYAYVHVIYIFIYMYLYIHTYQTQLTSKTILFAPIKLRPTPPALELSKNTITFELRSLKRLTRSPRRETSVLPSKRTYLYDICLDVFKRHHVLYVQFRHLLAYCAVSTPFGILCSFDTFCHIVQFRHFLSYCAVSTLFVMLCSFDTFCLVVDALTLFVICYFSLDTFGHIVQF